MIIAIDGPSASGKSTTAKGVSDQLNILHLDTGAMYRAITWACIDEDIDLTENSRFSMFIENLEIGFNPNNCVTLNGMALSDEIRKNKISSKVSEVSAIALVREKMVVQQRKIAKKSDCVIEGRDIGTVVFPDADYKFFLDAKPEIRSKRRMKDLKKIGEETTFEVLVQEIKMRDYVDSSRKNSPLSKAKDAFLIETDKITLNEQIEKIISLIKNK